MPTKKPTKKKKPTRKITREVRGRSTKVYVPPKALLVGGSSKKEKPLTLAQVVANAGLILESCNNDPHTAQFFLLWLQNGHNATQAYQTLHKDVSRPSAAVLGSAELRKIKKEAIMEAMGLGYDAYFRQLKAGMEATKKISMNFKTYTVDDHKVRRAYHEAAGKILGIEKDKQEAAPPQLTVATAINNWIVTDDNEKQ